MAGATENFDAVVIGAGFSGMYMLKSLRDKLGLKVRVYEAGETVGGTWYWNRYPGARCDSDAYIYCFTWDKQLLQEWEWSERYPEQPEILRYLEHVAKRHDLKRDMQFNTRVTGAEFDERTNLWTVHTDKGEEVTARYLIAAVGSLSATNMPQFKGLEKFKGKWYHTSRFPHAGVDFTGKRVGVVGTGATAVQAIPEIAQQAKQLTVFQRTANYCVPARNGKVDPEVVKARKADYDGVVKRIRESFFGQEHYFIPKSALETTPEEREREFDRMWDAGGFAFWLANYQDMFFDQEANDLCADYIKRKIRKTVKDPVVAEKLIPKGYAYGTKRQPLDTNYYETFNKDNVLLVDAKTDGAHRRNHRKGHPRRWQGIRVRHHRFRHRLRCDDRSAEGLEPERPRRPHAGRAVGGRSAHLPWHLGRRLPQPVHDHRSAKPVGAVEHAGVDRAACGVDHRLHRQHAQDRQDHHRGDAPSAGPMGRACQRDRQRDADDQRQLLVHERQHPRQAARLPALPGAGRCWRLPEEMRRGRGQGLRGIRIGVANSAKNPGRGKGQQAWSAQREEADWKMINNSYYSQEVHGPYELHDIGNLELEEGGTIRGCTLAYATFGTLNAAKDNAILIPTWYSGTNKIIEQVYIGKGRALDPDKYFIIVVNQIGNGLSTSPHNTPAPAGMGNFPHVRIGDDVRAQHKLITEKFGLKSLALVVGGSMGAQQTYEWAVRYPDMVKRAAPIAGTARNTVHDFLFTETLVEAITSDPGFNKGFYTSSADVREGLLRHAKMWAVMGWSTEFFQENRHKALAGCGKSQLPERIR